MSVMALFPVDMHAHTTASDGVLTPTELVQLAAGRGLRVLGVTDHDTVDGLAEAISAGPTLGLTVVPGVEFSTRHEYAKQFAGLHILGYFIDHRHPPLVETLRKVQEGRRRQKIEQIRRLQAFGFDISVEEVFSRVKGVPGRPHIAAVLMERNPGRFASVQQVFDEYLGVFKKAHVRREFALTVEEAIVQVKSAGGLPVLAHPGDYDDVTDPEALVRNALAAGIEGLEVYYPYNRKSRSQNLIAYFERLADELGLLKTGGTDFHGRPHETLLPGDMGLSEAQYGLIAGNVAGNPSFVDGLSSGGQDDGARDCTSLN